MCERWLAERGMWLRPGAAGQVAMQEHATRIARTAQDHARTTQEASSL